MSILTMDEMAICNVRKVTYTDKFKDSYQPITIHNSTLNTKKLFWVIKLC